MPHVFATDCAPFLVATEVLAAKVPARTIEAGMATRGRSTVREYAEVVIAILAVTIAGWYTPLSYEAFGHIYLFTVIALSLRVGRQPALFAAVASALAWDFVFLPPRMSFSILSLDDALLLGTYFVVALVGSQLTARARADQRAQHQRDLLAESERLHRALLDSVSHELKTPLSVLRAATEKLEGGELSTAVYRLERVVANLLDQSRLDAGGLRPQPDWCDVRDLVAAARRAVGSPLADRTVTLEIPADLPLFRSDAALMEHVLANLLLNAARHTPEGSWIRITAGRDGPNVFITVADNGPGLPPEMTADPFQKFRPAAGAGGLGLGLSIVRGFMRAQGGDVLAGSSPEGGASFTVILPYAEHGGVPDDEP